MSAYRFFIILFYPFALLAVTLVWFMAHPRFTWTEMYMNMWKAGDAN